VDVEHQLAEEPIPALLLDLDSPLSPTDAGDVAMLAVIVFALSATRQHRAQVWIEGAPLRRQPGAIARTPC
jgi:hypothetical protein